MAIILCLDWSCHVNLPRLYITPKNVPCYLEIATAQILIADFLRPFLEQNLYDKLFGSQMLLLSINYSLLEFFQLCMFLSGGIYAGTTSILSGLHLWGSNDSQGNTVYGSCKI